LLQSPGPLFDIVETVKAPGSRSAAASRAAVVSYGSSEEMQEGAVRATSYGNPGPIGPVGPLRRKNAMGTMTWHHRKSDRGAVLSGPIGPLCVIRAQSRHRRPAIPVRSVQSVHFARKTLWKQWLGTTANRTRALSSPVQSVHFAPSARSRGAAARQSRSDRSSRSTSPGKRYGNKDLAPPQIGPGRCPLWSNRCSLRQPGVRSDEGTKRARQSRSPSSAGPITARVPRSAHRGPRLRRRSATARRTAPPVRSAGGPFAGAGAVIDATSRPDPNCSGRGRECRRRCRRRGRAPYDLRRRNRRRPG
jgi:hypothetical protein